MKPQGQIPETTRAVPVSEASFHQEVISVREPVLVMFWAPWSRAHDYLLPAVLEVAKTNQGGIRVVTINSDDNLGLSLLYDIQSVPTLICFFEGFERQRIIGTASKEAILCKFGPILTPHKTCW